MRPINRLIVNAPFQKDPLGKRQAREGDEMFVRAAGDDGEFGVHVDERGGEGGEEVVQEVGCLVDDLGAGFEGVVSWSEVR